MVFLDFELSQSHGKRRNRAKVMKQSPSHGFLLFSHNNRAVETTNLVGLWRLNTIGPTQKCQNMGIFVQDYNVLDEDAIWIGIEPKKQETWLMLVDAFMQLISKAHFGQVVIHIHIHSIIHILYILSACVREFNASKLYAVWYHLSFLYGAQA